MKCMSHIKYWLITMNSISYPPNLIRLKQTAKFILQLDAELINLSLNLIVHALVAIYEQNKTVLYNNFDQCSLVGWLDSLRPIQHFFSYDGMFLPGLNQY